MTREKEFAQLRRVAQTAARSLYSDGILRVTPAGILDEGIQATIEDLSFYAGAFQNDESWNDNLVHRLFERIQNRLRLAIELSKLPKFDVLPSLPIEESEEA